MSKSTFCNSKLRQPKRTVSAAKLTSNLSSLIMPFIAMLPSTVKTSYGLSCSGAVLTFSTSSAATTFPLPRSYSARKSTLPPPNSARAVFICALLSMILKGTESFRTSSFFIFSKSAVSNPRP